MERGYLLRKARKGISPVLATLILIVIAVVVGILVFAWASGWIGVKLGAGEVQIRIDEVWVEDGYVHITVRNTGSTDAIVDSVMIEDLSWSVHYTVKAGSTNDIVVAYAWTYKESYKIRVGTTAGVVAEGTYSVARYETPYALKFDGTDDYVDLGNPATLNGMNDFTIEAWFKATSFYGHIIGKEYGAGGDDSYVIWFSSSNTISFHTSGGSGRLDYPGISLNKWYHIAVVKSGTECRMYVNGKLVDTAAGPATVSYDDSPVFVGADDNNDDGIGDGCFNGVIDDVRIYNRALSEDEILSNMKGAIATDGLVLWLRFDEGSGDMAYDVSGNANHGTLMNGPTWVEGITEDVVPAGSVLAFEVVLPLAWEVRRP